MKLTALAPRKMNAPQIAASAPRCLVESLSEVVDDPMSVDGSGPLQNTAQSEQRSRE